MIIGKKRKLDALSPPTILEPPRVKLEPGETRSVIQKLDQIYGKEETPIPGENRFGANPDTSDPIFTSPQIGVEPENGSREPFDLRQFHRFEVLSVERRENNKLLFLRINHFAHHREYSCLLSGQWIHSSIEPDDIVHIQSNRFENDTFHIDNEQGFITINPDTVIRPTLLSSSVYCMRKAWLGEKFRGWGFGNKYMLVGTIVHSLFQKACTTQSKTTAELDALLLQIAAQKNTIMECFVSEITVDQLITEVRVYIPVIVQWLETYITKGPGLLEDDLSTKIKVLTVNDIEDEIYCPALGSAGVIDVTLEVEIHSNSSRKAVIPLELKTGKPSFSAEHIGQISLYSMMMSNRNPEDGNGGLLLYLKDAPRMKLNQIKRPIASSLVQKRNELAYFLNKPKSGPFPKDSARACGNCEHLLDCCLMLKCFEPETLAETQIMNTEMVPAVLSHLTEMDLYFFQKWIDLIQMEMSESKRFAGDLAFWTESSETRESKGFGLSNLILHSFNPTHVILRRKSDLNSQPLTTHCPDFTGERVSISFDENSDKFVPFKVGILTGYVERMGHEEIEISIQKDAKSIDVNQTLRLDLLKYSRTYSTNYDNILRLMGDDDHCKRLRDLVAHETVARYKSKYNKSIVEIAKRIIKPLNEQQQRAVLKVINTEDYLLIRGTPGSGKTSVIVAIVRMLIEMGKTVLISSHTHAAVDNILLKLKGFGVDFVRIGSDYKIHPDLRDYTLSSKTSEIKSPDGLKLFYSRIKVAASTCLGVNSEPLFTVKRFDYCLLDEASQVLLPTSLGPLFASSKFILVGDEKQLPPVVKNRAAKEGGLENSLFTCLLSKESSSLQLAIQYRMNSEILRIPSTLFYDGALRCGNDSIASAVLPAPTLNTTGLPWLDRVLSPELTNSFLFLDTDQLDRGDATDYSGLIENPTEADLVLFLVKQFTTHLNLSPHQLGVISPFQKQVSLIKKKLDSIEILVNSVDQYQGKEKDCILISCVKQSCETNTVITREEILSDDRRINVAITRASKKCILIGSQSTLRLYQPFARLFSILRSDQIVVLPKKVYSLSN